MSTRVVAIGLASLLCACVPTPTASPTGGVVVTTSRQATAGPSLQPSPTLTSWPIATLEEDDLADVSLEDERPTAVCDLDPSNAYIGGPKSQIFCYDGLQYALRALRTRMASVERLYLHRGACSALPCTPSELGRVEVIGWRGSDAYTVVISSDPSFITVPREGAAAAWPATSSSMAPAVERPGIEGAPDVIDRREPYPYCGRERSLHTDQPAERKFEINRCFFDGVLEGRPVEMVMITDVTGQPVILRFDGHGFVTRYMQYGTPRAWYRDQGPVSLGGSVFFSMQNHMTGMRIDE